MPYRTKEEYVYDVLRASIMRCELRPGERLVIDNLSSELEVSPIPIRGALQRLQGEGLVEIIPHIGAVASEISPDDVNEIFALLEALESVAFRVAVPQVSDSEIAHLWQLVNEMEEPLQAGDANRWSDLNSQFHLAVARMAEMSTLSEFTSRALDSWDRLRRCYLKPIISERMSQAQAEHHQMIELLERRDVDGLVALTAQHNRRAKEAYQKLMQSQRSQEVSDWE